MFDRYKKAVIVLALSGATTMAGLAHAQSQGLATQAGSPVAESAQAGLSGKSGRSGPQAPWLSLGQVYDKLEAAGYSDVREIERENDGYEAKARDTEGRAVKLYIEPLEGRIVGEKVGERKREPERGSDRDKRSDRERVGERR